MNKLDELSNTILKRAAKHNIDLHTISKNRATHIYLAENISADKLRHIYCELQTRTTPRAYIRNTHDGVAVIVSNKNLNRSDLDILCEQSIIKPLAIALDHALNKPAQKPAPPIAESPKPPAQKKPKLSFDDAINEALDGMAVPDGMVQPQDGVAMLKQALQAPTDDHSTLAVELRKAGVRMNAAEPGSHVITFLDKNGTPVWQVEPSALSDQKTFDETLQSLWSIARGKAPNADRIEHDAIVQAAQTVRDGDKKLTDLSQSIISKFTPQDSEPPNAAR